GTQKTATLEIIDNDSSIQFSQANYQVSEDGTIVGVAITLNRTGVTTGTSNIEVQLANGTATGGTDFNNSTIPIIFAANETTKTVVVPITEDILVEGNENLTLALANPSANTAIGTQNTATLQIIDNDSSIQFSQGSYQVSEDGTVVGIAITLNRTGVTTGTSNIDVQLTNGTATGGVDFTNTTQNIIFGANETTKTVVVPITEDILVEGNENLTLTLANPSANTAIGTQNTATLQIIDNDSSIQFSQANYQVNENGTVVGVAITLNRTGVTTGTSNIDVQLADGTATGGTDFTATTQTINFGANETSKTVTVTITDDSLFEGNENLTLTLANSSANTAIGTQNTANLEILDNDSPPTVAFSQANYQVNENGTVVGVAVTINRTGDTSGTSNVDIQLTNGTATGGTDFTATTQTINFVANETSKTVTVPITDDSLFEGNENLNLTLVNPSGGTNIGSQNTANLTIVDNDSSPSVSFSQANYQVNENGTVVGAAITINRSGDISGTSNVQAQLTKGTATGGTDFDNSTQTISFGANETTKTVTVPITDDSLFEGNENLTLTLVNPSGGTNIGSQNTANLTIVDNDSPATVAFSQANYQVNENGTVVGVSVTINRTEDTSGTSNIDVQLTNGTATGGSDFNSATQTISFGVNETSKTVTVPIIEDSVVEGNENLTLTLANPSANTNIGTQKTATLEIIDNDNLPTVSIGDITIAESNSGTTPANFTLTLSAPSNQSVTVLYATADGTATTADNDYSQIFSGSIAFNPGEISKTISVAVQGDINVENNENFFVNLIGVTNATIADNQGVGTIINDDTEEDCFCEQIVHPNLDSFFDEGKEGYSLAQVNQTSNTLSGTESDDYLIGSNLNDALNGLGGNDFIEGKAGNDNLFGHNGKDTIFGGVEGSDRDWISGNEDDDLLNGNQGNDVINGNQGNDTVRGGKGNDIVRGGQDNDQMWGDSGDDTLMGDKGNDTIFGGVTAKDIGDSNGRDLILGGIGDDFLNGNEGDDTVCGNEGNDTVRGGKNDDIVFGDAGNDMLFGDLGNDSLCGEDGDDTIYGGNGSDVPIGSVGEKDCLCGGIGNDLLFGNEGEDKINGDEGDDTLYGGKDNDTLTGGGGNDWLSGDLGNDMLRGGSGTDRFVLSPVKGTDIILDFEDNVDLLELRGNLTFAQLTINQGSDGTSIGITKTGELLATLKGVPVNLITQQDFVLVN
ncbi:Calx-beta domain-containing protein, partial [Argonema galeatum]|uniref:Calx-beta domain-containing protein n=1 Tax=Argonema galeatum TaxID=2942762 RepID=UPI0023DF0190